MPATRKDIDPNKIQNPRRTFIKLKKKPQFYIKFCKFQLTILEQQILKARTISYIINVEKPL